MIYYCKFLIRTISLRVSCGFFVIFLFTSGCSRSLEPSLNPQDEGAVPSTESDQEARILDDQPFFPLSAMASPLLEYGGQIPRYGWQILSSIGSFALVRQIVHQPVNLEKSNIRVRL